MTETTNGSVQGALSDADVEQVVRLVESLDRSGFDFLEVQVGDLKVTIGKGEPPAPVQAAVPAPEPAPQAAAAPAVTAPAVSAPAVTAPEVTAAPAPATPGLLEITAPTMGIFYAQPEPGKPPFVTAGALVEESTTVALVEVMKTYHAVAAGVRGTVVEVCVSDADLVEFGQVLFRVDPEVAS
ncbi:acetyl-CoA carboxylase biotin carboxyl carrier protein [Pseudonocardia sp. DLS-67]